MAVLSVKNLGKRNGGRWVLWDVCFEVGSGETLAVMGRSGAGKSTLARIIAGIEEPSNGTVMLMDGDMESERGAVVAFDPPACAPDLTVQENIDLSARLWGVPRKRRAKEIPFLVELLELTERRNSPAGGLSRGELGRVEIAKALAVDSPLIVIDSGLDFLDKSVFERLWGHLIDVRRGELKSVVVFTSSGKVAEVCGRVAVMHRGRIGFVGPSEDLRRMAGEDMVVLGNIDNPMLRSRIQERLSVVIKEEEGFLSFRTGNGERMIGDLLSDFGSDLGCVYLKRPTLDDALDVIEGHGAIYARE